jgi:hypothetical protein
LPEANLGAISVVAKRIHPTIFIISLKLMMVIKKQGVIFKGAAPHNK